MKTFSTTSKKLFCCLFAAVLCLLSISAAHAQIYVSTYADPTYYGNSGSGTVGEYNYNGTPINASLISSLPEPSEIQTYGSNIFVGNELGTAYSNVQEYTSSGTTLNAGLWPAQGGVEPPDVTFGPDSFTVSGGVVYGPLSIIGGVNVDEYTTSGNFSGEFQFSEPSPTDAAQIAISGSNVFILIEFTGDLGEYTTSGNVVNSSLITGLVNAGTLAVSGSNVFIPNLSNNTIAEYTTSGVLENSSLITTQYSPVAVTVAGSDIYVVSRGTDTGYVGEYTTSGATVNASLIEVAGNPLVNGIAIGSQTQPVTTTTTTPSTIQPNATYSTTTVTPVTANGGLGTTVSIIAGSNPSNTQSQTVTLASNNAGSQFSSLASDVFSVSGNDGTVFTLQLTFDLNAANQVGGPQNMVLLYNSTNNGWENAVLGDHNPDGTYAIGADAVAGFQGSFASFLTDNPLANTNLSLYLGSYGVDANGDTVWAIINHNSDFSTGNLSDLPQEVQATPEPSTWAMLLGGLGLLAFWRLRARGRSDLNWNTDKDPNTVV